MTKEIERSVERLVDRLAQHPSIRAIGRSGGELFFPEPGTGDIDLFLYCTAIPAKNERNELLSALGAGFEQVAIGKLEAGHWGQGDCLFMAGVETWLLYFTQTEACTELEAILDGQYLGRLDSYYYPMGRCAMWKSMHVLYDPDGFLQSLKNCLAEYPQALSEIVIMHHWQALDDVEDLERAVGRKDVLFYHFAIDLALDHFLQALFALNKEFFPSRKRSESYLQSFRVKPEECEGRLREVLALGGKPETLEQSYKIWYSLVNDLHGLIEVKGKT